MPLPSAIRDYEYAVRALNPVFRRTQWGAVIADARFPDIWDANQAAVLEDDPSLTIEEIRAQLLPELRAARAGYEHVEFWGTAPETPALEAIETLAAGRDPDVVMTFRGRRPSARSRSSEIRVEALGEPDDDFWAWYRSTRNMFGQQLTESTIDQMTRRDREIFLPAGLRWFVAYIGERMAGFTSLLSLVGVGYIENVVTMPDFRRRGVATATVTAATRASLERGDRVVFLLAEENGDPQRLYERLGFRVEARVLSFTRPLVKQRPR